MQKKAEKILAGLGLEHFELRSSQWRALSRSMDYKWVPDGRYGLKLSYCRNVDGIPEPSGGGAAWGMGSGPEPVRGIRLRPGRGAGGA